MQRVGQFIAAHGRFIAGLGISTFGGQIVIWPLLTFLRWYAGSSKHKNAKGTNEAPRGLSWVTGLVERLLYTIAFALGAPQWVGLWMAMKIAARWKTEKDDNWAVNNHLWIIGSGISVAFGYLGALVALGKLPCVK